MILHPLIDKLRLPKIIILIIFIFQLNPGIVKSQVIINEIMAYNTTGILNPDLYLCTDWIEIYNDGEDILDLSYYSLSDNPENLNKWDFPVGTYPGDGWNSAGFDDSAWSEGQAELGYGDGGEITVLDFGPDANSKYITYYFRKEIEIESLSQYTESIIRLMRDDGAVVYINGKEVLRVLMLEGDIYNETPAANYANGTDESTYFEYYVDSLYLTAGTNVIAVEIHQSGATSTDISFDMELTGSYSAGGEPFRYEESELSLSPTGGLIVQPVFIKSDEIPDIVINEFMATNQDAYEDEFGEDADWFRVLKTGLRL